MLSMTQEAMKIEMVGTVTAPPDLSSILADLADAVANKQEFVLAPGAARVLHNHLEATT